MGDPKTRARQIVQKLIPHLTDDLRRAPWKGSPNCLAGHCYVASEALYHLLGGSSSGYSPHQIQHEGASHWFLKNRETGDVIDFTAGQFRTPVAYDKAVGKGFLTLNPSKRARVVIDAVRARKLGKTERADVVSIAVIRDGKLLVGLRGSSGKWNLPGGHVESGETLRVAAERELKEETGLVGSGWQELGFCDVRAGLRVYSFICTASGDPDAGADPDEEMSAFVWMPVESPPKTIMEKLHNPKDVTLQFLGLQDETLELIWDEEAPSSVELEGLLSKSLKPAFQHRHTNQIVVSPGYHNTDLLPGGEFTQDWVDGFVDEGGRFFDRDRTQYQFGLSDSHQLSGEADIEKFELALEDWLIKATDPTHFKGIAKAVTAEGRRFVDHSHQLNAHPPTINHEVERYRGEILHGPKTYKALPGKMAGGGITRKLVFRMQPKRDLSSPTGETSEFYMIKPYHENVVRRISKWQKYPIQGWAEMANQALYHAGGIGHLHQKVHISEHDMGAGYEKEPALVIHLEKGFKPVGDSSLPGHDPSSQPIVPSEGAMSDARKIALMDFLTNNLDRHSGNLLISEDGERIKAIDHSRSFQYMNNHKYKWSDQRLPKYERISEDRFAPYAGGRESNSSIGHVDPYLDHHYHSTRPTSKELYDENMRRMRNYDASFEWWGQNSANIKKAFDTQLLAIKDPVVRDHIRRNFNARARWLDERTHFGIENFGTDWHRDPVDQYKPGVKADDEIEAEERAAAVAQYEEEQRKRVEAA